MSEARKKPDWWRYTNASSIGIEMAIAIVLGWWCGRWLETNVTHWKPWTSMIGLLLGVAAAGMAIVRTAREYSKELAAERQEREAREATLRAEIAAEHGASAPASSSGPTPAPKAGDPTPSPADAQGSQAPHSPSQR